MRLGTSLLATALLVSGCQRIPYTFVSTAPQPTDSSSSPYKAAAPTPSGPDALVGQSIFHGGNGNGTPGCVACHPGTMLADKTADDIKTCLAEQAPMIADFGPQGVSPLTDARIADVAAYIASANFPN